MKTKKILMLEHDVDDRFITSTFFKEYKDTIALDFVSSSDEFFQKLNSYGKPSDFPSLILMSMNTVPVDAIGILKRMKAENRYDHIPVVVLCAARNEKRIRECYEQGASSVILKPDGHKSTNKKILSFIRYWFETVELAV